MKGKFITFEGCEGSGKSTQLKLLIEYLDKNGVDYVFTREPGGTEISEKIRKIILDIENSEMCDECEALLYSAARIQHVKQKIFPALSKGKLVLCDRYIHSSYAYQAYARGLGDEYIKSINNFAIKECSPNYTIFLNITPEDAFNRKGGMDKDDRLEQSGMEFHKKVYDGYVKSLNETPEKTIMIDCSGSKYQTHNKIISELKKRDII